MRVATIAVALLLSAVFASAAAASSAARGSPAVFTARGSVEQVQVTAADPGSKVSLINSAGKVVATRRAGALGGIVFRNVKPGSGYRARKGAGGGPQTPTFRVLSDRPAPPSTNIYSQTLPAGGYGYLRTRDGTQLAINVQLPGPAESGPYPTLVEYSGYGYARPTGGESSIAQIATALGFAVVDVNMRGTGCSGGAFDFFEPLQGLDGYDVVETVARQPWALHHKAGMMGVSYGGISQLFVAATRPPSLSAITPLSVIDDPTFFAYPGGIKNTGFNLSWVKDRVHDALPASPTGGQAWAWERIQNGDGVCAANQVLHTEAVDLLAKFLRNRYYVPKVVDPLAPGTFVDKIKVPVFLACQWTDEQTGGHCPAMTDRFTGTRRKWFTFTNGTHIDSLAPATFNRWYDFLELYVARQKPQLTPGEQALAPVIYSTAMGVPGVTLPSDPIQAEPDYASARAAFENLPPIRILFDNGAGGAPGAPYAGFERSFSRFPLPKTKARSWYLGRNGALTDRRPVKPGAEAFRWDRNARPSTSFTGSTNSSPGGLWTATPVYQWLQSPPGKALSYVSPKLKSDTTVVGGGAVEAWIRASVPNVDLQVTVSEVRPDGNETFVQNGWLKAAARKLDPKSTLLEPVLSLRKADRAPLPKNRFTKVTVPLYYEGHAYRKDSRIRITIAAPDGDQPRWEFGTANPATATTVALAHSPQMPSRVVLPVIGGVNVPTALPPCPSLRGEPCRPYVPYTNRKISLP